MKRLLLALPALGLLAGCGAGSSGGSPPPNVHQLTHVKEFGGVASVQKINVDGTPCVLVYTRWTDGGVAISCDWTQSSTPTPEATP